MTEKKVEEVVYPLKPWNFKNGWSFISIKSHDRFLIAWKLSQQARSPFFFFPHHLGLLLLDGLEGNPSKRSSRSPGIEAATWKEYDFYQQGWSIFNSNNIWNWCQEYQSTMLERKNMEENGLVAAPYSHQRPKRRYCHQKVKQNYSGWSCLEDE